MKLKDMSLANMRSLIDLGFVHKLELEDLVNLIENNTSFMEPKEETWKWIKQLLDKELLEIDVDVKIEATFTDSKNKITSTRYMFCDKKYLKEVNEK